MIGLKDQCFGVEVEMTGITREQAAQALANYFGTTPRYKGGTYDAWVSIWGNPTTACVAGNGGVGSLWDNVGTLRA